MHITVVGGGSWGTALAHLCAGAGHNTRLLLRDAAVARSIAEKRENPRYLPGLTLAEGIRPFTDPAQALAGAQAVICATPCQGWRQMLRQIRPHLAPGVLLVCASKGVEIAGLCTMASVAAQELEALEPIYAVLSGPSFAEEVVRGLPTAVVLGCADAALRAKLREAFTTPVFRVYSSPDVTGVELGGAVKNVIAIAAGISDGLGFGLNARAALITRGLAETTRLGLALGACAATFQGLSGMGDLVLTCSGHLSRNRQVGLRLARGETLEAITQSMGQTAEGVRTVTALVSLARKNSVPMPIAEIMQDVLHNGLEPLDGVRTLMARTLKEENA